MYNCIYEEVISLIRIKAERAMLGLSQKDFAEKLNVSIPTVQKWEYGDVNMPCDQLCRVSDFFGCSVDWLLGRSERRK